MYKKNEPGVWNLWEMCYSLVFFLCHWWKDAHHFFFKKMGEVGEGDISPFCRATDAPVLDFCWRLPWVLKPGLIPHLCASSLACSGFLMFITSKSLLETDRVWFQVLFWLEGRTLIQTSSISYVEGIYLFGSFYIFEISYFVLGHYFVW